MLSATVSLLWG